MPLAGLVNPLTGAPTVGPLAVLVDHAAGLVNHYRRASDEWTVSSELSLEITPAALTVIADNPEAPVVASAQPVGTRYSTALGMCEITLGDAVIGIGTVRSVYVAHPGEFPQRMAPPVDGDTRPTDLAEIMALQIDHANGSPVMHQGQNPALNNSLGIVHGGVAAAGLELAASAALNAGRSGPTAAHRVVASKLSAPVLQRRPITLCRNRFTGGPAQRRRRGAGHRRRR